jgi:hypothetical protein
MIRLWPKEEGWGESVVRLHGTDGWSLSGILTQFRFAGQKSIAISEATIVLERQVGAHADPFLEYVGVYPNHARRAQFINTGSACQLT